MAPTQDVYGIVRIFLMTLTISIIASLIQILP